MAVKRQVIETRISDLSGVESTDVTTVKFSWDGKAYKLDLTAGELAEFDGLMTRYVQAAVDARATNGGTADGDDAKLLTNGDIQQQKWLMRSKRKDGVQVRLDELHSSLHSVFLSPALHVSCPPFQGTLTYLIALVPPDMCGHWPSTLCRDTAQVVYWPRLQFGVFGRRQLPAKRNILRPFHCQGSL